jgi:hypothetical protein
MSVTPLSKIVLTGPVLVVGLACQVMAAVRQQVDGIRFADKRCAAVIVPED